jgi:peptidoglycan/xylan/chitin deacetylase (PgdA/CDA1 family)
MTSWTGGDAKWYFQNIPVTPGKTYLFKDFYKASALTTTIARYRDASGTRSYERLGSNPKSASWRESRFTFTAPDDALVATIFHVIAATGTLQTCLYSVVEATAPAFHRSIVSLSFDDGYRSVHELAWPVMREHGFKSTHYIVTRSIGSKAIFDHQMMSDREIEELYKDGNEIGSHTETHPRLSRVLPAQLESELSQSQMVLNASYPPVDDLALPYGDYDDAVIAAVKKHYRSCRTSDPGYNTSLNFDPYRIRIQHVPNHTSLKEFQDWLARAARERAWLVLLYHRIDSEADDEYSVTPKAFAAQMKALHASGQTVLTVRQALDELSPQISK